LFGALGEDQKSKSTGSDAEAEALLKSEVSALNTLPESF
jgi:hypothetical protein